VPPKQLAAENTGSTLIFGSFSLRSVRLCGDNNNLSQGEIGTMCEANAYLLKDGKEELILEAVDVVETEDGQIRVANIFGEQKTFRGRIKSMSLVNHKIILEE
jgi:predicted RNA-binding protein